MDEIKITPLGTVSPYCKGNMNCPGFLVETNQEKILLDCGNGITRYLDLIKDLNNLTIIISHLHKDHYGDLLNIAQSSYVLKRLGYLQNKIKVYIPNGDKISVKEDYKDNEDWVASRMVKKNLLDFDYIMDLSKVGYLEIIPYDNKFKLNFDNMELSFSKNPHQIITYSTKLETEGLKLVYSSDTGYYGNSLEEFAKDANLLICESTFLRSQIKSEDSHLFAYEAGLIAKNANVEKLLLTHFWPEIDKQNYVDEAKEYFDNVEASVEGKVLRLKR